MKTTMILASMALAFSSAVQAQPAQSAQEGVAVSFAGLNLTTVEGQQALDHRLLRAVKDYCEAHTPGDMGRMTAQHQCAQDLLAKARPQLAQVVADANSRFADIGKPGASR